jgi:N-acetylglucosamine malate deacetylase 2
MLLAIVVIGIILFVLFWLFCLLYQHDFSIPLFDPTGYKKVLAIYPHPDDEVATVGGTLCRMSANGSHVTLLTMTRGDKGETCIPLHEPIGVARGKELENAVHILGLKELVLMDLGDGTLVNKKEELCRYIEKEIQRVSPDLVISFDTSGLYGHPDHIALSEAVTKTVKSKFPAVKLWYSTETKQSYKHIKLPVHMAKDPGFLGRRTAPTYRIWTGGHVIALTRALYAHRCQLAGFKRSLPINWLPIWFFTTQRVYEYVYEVKNA